MLGTYLKGSMAAGDIEYVGGYVQGFAGTTSNVTISLTSLTGGTDSAPSAGDFVLVYFGTASREVNSDLVVSGYTEVVDAYRSNRYATNLAVAYKFMGAGPDTSFTLTGGTKDSSDAGAIAVQVWRNVSVVNPLDVSLEFDSNDSSVLCNPDPITPVSEGAVVIAGGAGAHDEGNRVYSSSDLTNFISVGGTDSNDVTVGLGYHVWSSGSFNPSEFTFSGSDNTDYSNIAITLALRPS